MLQNSNRLLGPRNDVTRMEKNGRIIWSFDVDFEISFFYFCLIFLSTSQQNVSFFLFLQFFKISETFLKREKKNHSVLLHHRFVSNDKVFFWSELVSIKALLLSAWNPILREKVILSLSYHTFSSFFCLCLSPV